MNYTNSLVATDFQIGWYFAGNPGMDALIRARSLKLGMQKSALRCLIVLFIDMFCMMYDAVHQVCCGVVFVSAGAW